MRPGPARLLDCAGQQLVKFPVLVLGYEAVDRGALGVERRLARFRAQQNLRARAAAGAENHRDQRVAVDGRQVGRRRAVVGGVDSSQCAESCV